jgi:TP901 family phage tail tape measure protein
MAIRKGNTLWWKTGMDNTGLKKGSAQAKGILRTMSQQITGMDLFAGVGAAAVLAFAKVSKAAFAMAKDFDKAMREVQTISAAGQANYEGMINSVRTLAKEVPEDAQGLAKALYQIVSAGYDGAEGMVLLEVATKAAVAGVTDTITAADGLTSAMNAWKISTDRANEVSDIFFTTVRLGKTTFAELSNSIALVAPLAASFGVELYEVNSAVATLTKQGTPTAVAMTQIRQILVSLNEQFGQGWRETMTFQEAVEALRKKADDAGVSLKEFTGRIEGAVGGLGLTGDNADMARADLEEFRRSLGATADAYELMMKAAENQIKVMKSRWHDKLLEYGTNLTRMFGNLAFALNSKAMVRAVKEEQYAINGATSAILELEEGTKEREKALNDLKLAYPEFFDGLDTENTKNETLIDILEQVNEKYRDRITLTEQLKDERGIENKIRNLQVLLEQTKEAMVKYVVDLGLPGGTIDQMYEQLRGLSKKDLKELGLGQWERAFFETTLNDFDAYNDRMDELLSKQGDIKSYGIELKNALQIDPTDLGGVTVSPEGAFLSETYEAEKRALEEQIKLNQEALDAEVERLDEAAKAYEEWDKIKSTSMADELQSHYTLWLKKGDTLKAYYKQAYIDAEGNAELQFEIAKRLALMEYDVQQEKLEALEKLEKEYIKRSYDRLKEAFEKQLTEIQRMVDKSFGQFEIDLMRELEGEDDEIMEIAKAYEYMGGVIFRTDKEQEDFLDSIEDTKQAMIQLIGGMSLISGEADTAAKAVDGMVQALLSIAASGGSIMGIVNAILIMTKAVFDLLNASKRAKEEAQERRDDYMIDKLSRDIDLFNRNLEDQIELLSELRGTKWYDQYWEELQEVTLAQTKYNKELGQTFLYLTAVDAKGNKIKVDTELYKGKSIEEQRQFIYDNYDALTKAERESYLQYLDEIERLQEQEQLLRDQYRGQTVGFNADFITDEIVSAFQNAEDGVVDFAATFEEVMREAMMNVWKQRFIEDQVTGFYDSLFTAIESKSPTGRDRSLEMFGGIDSIEMSELRDQWEEVMVNAQEGWDAFQQFFDETMPGYEPPDKEGLAGAIKGISEDTAQILAGQITAIRFNILQNQEIAEDSLASLQAIEQNTSYNYLLYNVFMELVSIKNRLGGVR